MLTYRTTLNLDKINGKFIPQSPKTIPNLQLSINSKHWKSEEGFDYEKAAAI